MLHLIIYDIRCHHYHHWNWPFRLAKLSCFNSEIDSKTMLAIMEAIPLKQNKTKLTINPIQWAELVIFASIASQSFRIFRWSFYPLLSIIIYEWWRLFWFISFAFRNRKILFHRKKCVRCSYRDFHFMDDHNTCFAQSANGGKINEKKLNEKK